LESPNRPGRPPYTCAPVQEPLPPRGIEIKTSVPDLIAHRPALSFWYRVVGSGDGERGQSRSTVAIAEGGSRQESHYSLKRSKPPVRQRRSSSQEAYSLDDRRFHPNFVRVGGGGFGPCQVRRSLLCLTWLRLLSVIDSGRRVPDSMPQTDTFAENQSTGPNRR
jgi:hypothetical protein